MAHRKTAFRDDSSSDSSDEDQDYFLHPSTDPNADEFADYNPRKRRRTGRDQKESAALGIFGSESEDDGPGKRWKNKNVRAKGMAFVKPGQKLQDSDDDEDEDDDDDDDAKFQRTGLGAPKDVEEDEDEEMEDMEDVEENPKPRMGLGATATKFGLGGGGLGRQSPAMKRAGLGTTASSPLGRGFVPSSAGVPILQEREDDKPSPRVAMPSAFSTPTAAKRGKGSGNAKNGTPVNAGSFAARMMAKMGYKEGQGLGKEGQGRSGVIEVQLRPQGVGLGAVKEKSKQEKTEERRQAAMKGEVLEDSEEEERKRRRKPKTSGTDSGMSTPKRRPKKKYQSLPEIRRAAPGLQIPDAFTPILDMTGPGHRLLTSSSGLLTPTGVPESTELVEAKKLARRAQSDLGAFVEEWKNLEERKAWVQMEIMQQQQAIDEQKSHSDEMTSVASIVQGLSDAVRDGQWDPVIKALIDVESLGVTGNEELASIAVAAVHPFFRQAVEGWQPLEDSKLSGVAANGFAPALYSIRHLLGMDAKRSDGKSLALRDTSNGIHHSRAYKSTPYESMMYTVWLPKVRSAITNTWDVQDPSPLLVLLEVWNDLLPEFIKSQILDQLVVRKLDEAVVAWNPKKKRHSSLPHLWLFPWLQYLPAHHADPKGSTGLVSDVKRKFRQLIDSWDFQRGVIPGLQQWRSVLRPHGQSDQWTPLIVNHVLPHLAKFLRANFQVAPQDQEPYLPILNKTFEWHDILGPKIMGQLIVDEMFPMWHDVLHQWLTLDGVNYEEIGAWFEFWKGLIPDETNGVSAVNNEWERGMALINQALDLGPKAKSDLPAPSKTDRTRKNEIANEIPKPAPNTPAIAVPEIEEMSFRQQLEDWCMAHDLQFIPEKSTLEANGPVYRVTAAPIGKGGVLIYLRGDGIYAQIKRGVWLPLGKEMDALLELANR